MLKSYKYRIYPNKCQEQMLNKTFGCCRLVYNISLAKKKELYERDKTNISIYDLVKDITLLKKQDEFSFLKEVNSQSLQNILADNLNSAFNNYFRRIKDSSIKGKGYPRFKSKHDSHQSFSCPITNNNIKINFQYNKLCIPKIRDIKVKIDRHFDGLIKSCTISKTCTEKFYVSILVENYLDLPLKNKIEVKTSIGLDLGIKHFCTLSDGTRVENPRFLKRNLIHLKDLQRNLSKKVKKSKNRNKARLLVARQHEKIANLRKDFLHKLSHSIVTNSENQTICIEDLNIKGMLKNHYLAQAISDVSWSEFVRQLKYKSEWYGKNLLQCGRYQPSSKQCGCGHIYNDLNLNDRLWTCPKCDITNDRDLLASRNIKRFCLENNVL